MDLPPPAPESEFPQKVTHSLSMSQRFAIFLWTFWSVLFSSMGFLKPLCGSKQDQLEKKPSLLVRFEKNFNLFNKPHVTKELDQKLVENFNLKILENTRNQSINHRYSQFDIVFFIRSLACSLSQRKMRRLVTEKQASQKSRRKWPSKLSKRELRKLPDWLSVTSCIQQSRGNSNAFSWNAVYRRSWSLWFKQSTEYRLVETINIKGINKQNFLFYTKMFMSI